MNEALLSKRQEKTRQAFLNALLHLVAQHGLDRISVTDIANAADYGRWTFYQYFESKEDAAWAAFEHWMTHLDSTVVQAVCHLSSPRREYESWRLIFQAFQQHRPFLTRLGSVSVSQWRVQAKEFLVKQFQQHLHNGTFALMDGIRPEIAARLYVAALMELLEHWGRHPDLGDTDRLVDEFFTFIFNQPPPQ